MSENTDSAAVLTLEDLFLSREFGRPRNANIAGEPTLFGRAPLGGPLVPRVVTSVSGLAGLVAHDTPTHIRRNRAFAAVSGVAAALLVAVGFVSHAQTSPGSSTRLGTAALGAGGAAAVKDHSSKTLHRTTGTPGTTNLVQPTGGNSPGSGGGANINVASFTERTGTTSAIHTIQPSPIVTSTAPGTTVGSKPTKPSAPTVTAPAPSASGNVLTPVVTLVGHTVTTVGNTASTAATGLAVTLPPLSPVTSIVGSLGGDLTGLGDSLVGTVI
jgi:hypothetical protein